MSLVISLPKGNAHGCVCAAADQRSHDEGSYRALLLPSTRIIVLDLHLIACVLTVCLQAAVDGSNNGPIVIFTFAVV